MRLRSLLAIALAGAASNAAATACGEEFGVPQRLEGDRYRAVGLLFHMSGRWDLTFDLTDATGTERLTATLQLE